MSISSSIDLALNISRFDANTRAEVNKQLLEMEKELKKKLLDPDLSDFNRRRVETLLKECEVVIQAYYGDISGIVKGATDGAVGVVIKATAASLVAELPSALEVSLPTANMVKAIMSNVMIPLNGQSPLVKVLEKYETDAILKFQGAVRQGLLQAETNAQIIKRVEVVLESTRKDAARLTQTAVHSVANAARMATYEENSDLIASYSAVVTFDRRTCSVCASYSGLSWDINKKPIGHDKIFPNYPIHLSDRCSMVANTKSWKELGFDLPEPKVGTRASDEGQVSRNITFDEFLKGKSQAYVDDMLGKGRADLFRRGVISLQDLTNGATRPLTLKELEAKYT